MASNVLVFFLILLLTFSAHGETAKVRFCEDPWPPFVKGELDQIATEGISVRVLQEVLRRVDDVELEVLILPWKRCLKSIEDGTFDGYVDGIYSSDREAYITVTDPYYYGYGTWVYSKEKFPNGFNWKTYADFKEYKLVGVLGWHYNKVDNAIDKGLIKLHRARTIEDAFHDVLRGGADFTISEHLSLRAYIKNKDEAGILEATAKPAYVTLRRIGIGKKSPLIEKLPEINQVIGELQVEGFIDAVIQHEL